MRKAAFFLASLVLAVLMSGYNANADEIGEKIDRMTEQSLEFMKSGDYEKTLQFYTEDCISMPSYHTMIKGKEELKAYNEEIKKSGMKFLSMEFERFELYTCGDLVYEMGTYTMSMKIPAMAQPYKDIGKYITIYEMQDDGSLKIKVETWNSDINPWMEMQKSMQKGKK